MHSNVTPRPETQRRARCLRHHVWMAACADCKDARALPAERAGRDR
jgi:hypothetical protein